MSLLHHRMCFICVFMLTVIVGCQRDTPAVSPGPVSASASLALPTHLMVSLPTTTTSCLVALPVASLSSMNQEALRTALQGSGQRLTDTEATRLIASLPSSGTRRSRTLNPACYNASEGFYRYGTFCFTIDLSNWGIPPFSACYCLYFHTKSETTYADCYTLSGPQVTYFEEWLFLPTCIY